MTVTDIFNQDCRATVFDPPCPTSFVEDKRVVGNLVVQADPMFGGGELSANGPGDTFRFAVTKEELVARSAGNVSIEGGTSRAFNDRGGVVSIRAGDGASLHGGHGGALDLRAGDGFGQAAYGGNIGDGGKVSIEAGTAYEGYGGSTNVAAGASLSATGGSLIMTSGYSGRTTSGYVSVTSSNAGGSGRSGTVVLQTGTSALQSSGVVSISTGTAKKSTAGRIQISVGTSGSGSGSTLHLGAGATSTASSDAYSGGVISLISGYSPSASSGALLFQVRCEPCRICHWSMKISARNLERTNLYYAVPADCQLRGPRCQWRCAATLWFGQPWKLGTDFTGDRSRSRRRWR